MLPARLHERLEPGAAPPRRGELVVYWMRGAVRVDENPALEVASLASAALKAPLVVYQCVSTGVPWASDRHVKFALEGAREVQRALESRGVRCVLEVRAEAFSSELFARAAVVVTDFVPVPSWRAADVEAEKFAPLWRVDASCVVPVWSATSMFESLEALRAARATEWRLRVEAWPETNAAVSGREEREVAGVYAVDHSVAPVHHVCGGARAAMQRWRTFRDGGFVGDASLLSAHLQYGHLSPFTVLREAAAVASDDARDFVERFLGERELAWNFCLHHEKPAHVDALPDWARETLRAHERDGRTQVPSWEQLARAQTGDLLWDAAQRQLLTHGELRDDVRATWLSALIPWTRTTAEALHVAVELNTRYALDGNDPTSYLRIARCFGAFETPSPLDATYFGTVRARTTQQHARLLDVAEFERRAHRPSRGSPLTVAVVGAGVAGAAAARALVDAGHVVTLFDRGRGAGGRLSTRTEGPLRFDHGAPYFTVRDERFARWARGWWQERALGQWRGVIEGEPRGEAGDLVKLLGTPSMDVVVKRMLLGLDARFGVDVKGLTRDGSRWRLLDASGHPLGEYEVAVVATPAPRAAELIDPSSYQLASRVRDVVMDPCWAVLAHFNEGVGLAWDGLRNHVGPLAWLARNSSKPERPLLAGESWVLHASAEWSRAHLEDEPDAVSAALMDAFWATTGARAQVPVFVTAKRWRYAVTQKALGESCLWDAATQLAVCGDWCLGARVEDAFLSGTAAAARINSIAGGELPTSEPPRAPESQLPLI